MTDVVADAIIMIEERIEQIGEELERYDALRTEKRDLERLLAKMRPPVKQPKAVTGARPDGKPSIHTRLVSIFEADPDSMTVSDVQAELEVQGWSTNAADPTTAVRNALESMVRAGELEKPRGDLYRLA